MNHPFLHLTFYPSHFYPLLPKLISGELRLPATSIAELAAQAGIEDAEKIMEETLT